MIAGVSQGAAGKAFGILSEAGSAQENTGQQYAFGAQALQAGRLFQIFFI